MKVLGIIMLLVIGSLSIGLPLIDNSQRCMIIYTDDESETLKLDVIFPELPGQVNGEIYQITVTDTETNKGTGDRITNGKYRK